MSGPTSRASLALLQSEIIDCRRCPRLVAWREEVARVKRAAYRDDDYWGRPVPGFGDPRARLLIVGLAPGAHGANRTGRPFTGDRSGDFLYAALHRAGFANQPISRQRRDGLKLIDCWITGCVRCAPPGNRPTPAEFTACRPFLARELQMLPCVAVVLCLGGEAWKGTLRALAELEHVARPTPRFGHGAEAVAGAYRLIGCYHPSQQNTFTGRLTAAMMDGVLGKARALLSLPNSPRRDRRRVESASDCE